MKIQSINKNINSLYVHIPFCEHICFYCDFVKVKKPTKNEKVIYDYLDNLEKELLAYGDRLNHLQTIYIGGGTPSCLDEKQTIRMCEILNKYVNKCTIEYTIELNPESVTKEKLLIYKNNNINRLSMGIQTFDNSLLKKVGRIHDNKEAIDAYKLIRQVGFDNVSIDLMYNLFDQEAKNIETDLNYIKELKPDHISWYSLIMKEKSIWGKLKYKKPSKDEDFDILVNKGLKKLGYVRYEISNYSLKDEKKSLHNISYWNSDLFAGVGVGASGFEIIDNKYYLTCNEGNFLSYKKKYELVSENDFYFQVLMMGLRLIGGINLEIEINKYAYKAYEEKINENINKNFLEVKDNHLKCTERGLNILNEILVSLL
ncbi:coproporphyrinogen III oxidase [Spiroplasma corruscae]|uniref:Heme chaperone HemW n=1 Tax=Spiroplasma corruscae TaxID=216934 RepID=A0A222EPQ4_9MOLU|nr:radical SAM family heme chaperone HemW [Spiroplasma corruscae]ASP28510.1 coproporphyrinogen III oxidase [Spiroplasma corruscae]